MARPTALRLAAGPISLLIVTRGGTIWQRTFGTRADCEPEPVEAADAAASAGGVRAPVADTSSDGGLAACLGHAWTSLEGEAATPPAAIVDSAGRLQLMVVGHDGVLRSRAQSMPSDAADESAVSALARTALLPWLPWETLPVVARGSPRALLKSNAAHLGEFFVRGADGGLLQLRRVPQSLRGARGHSEKGAASPNASAGWEVTRLGGAFASGPVAALNVRGDATLSHPTCPYAPASRRYRVGR